MVAFAAGALASLAAGATTAATAATTGLGSALGLTAAAAPAAATAGTAAASAGASLFAGATPSIFASILQGGAGLVGAMGAIRAGQAQQDSLNAQATGAELDAAQQGIQAQQQTTSLKQKLVETLGQRDVAYGASGIDTSFGTPAVARGQAITDAAGAVSETQDQSAETSNALLARAAMFRKMASDAGTAGDVSALGDVLSTGAKIAFGSGRNASGI